MKKVMNKKNKFLLNNYFKLVKVKNKLNNKINKLIV